MGNLYSVGDTRAIHGEINGLIHITLRKKEKGEWVFTLIHRSLGVGDPFNALFSDGYLVLERMCREPVNAANLNRVEGSFIKQESQRYLFSIISRYRSGGSLTRQSLMPSKGIYSVRTTSSELMIYLAASIQEISLSLNPIIIS